MLFKLAFPLTVMMLSAIHILTISQAAFAQQTNENEYSFGFKWGSNGTGDGQFILPHGIDFDSKGNVYITDRIKNDIQKFTPNGTFLMKWGDEGKGDGQFRVPYSVIVDKYDNVYVVERDNKRIQKFDSNGNFVQRWNKFDDEGSTITMRHPEAMAMDRVSGDVYITDTGNNRTIKLDKDFNFEQVWGSYGTDEGEFNHPHGIGVDSSGNVFVNEYFPRIQKFDKDGNFIKQWGSVGRGNGEFDSGLEHLFVDLGDNVWQVDGPVNPRIQKFDNDGNYITHVGSGPCIIPDSVKNDPKQMASYNICDGKLHEPEQAGMNSKGDLYVVDRGNQRIVVYSPVKQ